MDVHPADTKEEMLFLNPQRTLSDNLLILPPKLSPELFTNNDETLKPLKAPSDGSPKEKSDKPKKQLMFQGISEIARISQRQKTIRHANARHCQPK